MINHFPGYRSIRTGPHNWNEPELCGGLSSFWVFMQVFKCVCAGPLYILSKALSSEKRPIDLDFTYMFTVTYRLLVHILLMMSSPMWVLHVLYPEVCKGVPPFEGEYACSDEEEIECDEDTSFCNSSTFLCSSARRYNNSFRFWCTGIWSKVKKS